MINDNDGDEEYDAGDCSKKTRITQIFSFYGHCDIATCGNYFYQFFFFKNQKICLYQKHVYIYNVMFLIKII